MVNSGSEALTSVGRRERRRLETRARIREATRQVFVLKGYHSATTREIAELADVAIGTLFAYASDKRELLMMVINDDRETFPGLLRKPGGTPRDVLGTLLGFFEPRYRYWAAEPELSRLAVQHTVDYSLVRDPGMELQRFYAGRQLLIEQLADFFQAQQKQGAIVASQTPDAIAWLFMAIYQAEVREWLRAREPKVSTGMERLGVLFSLALAGVATAVPPARRPLPETTRDDHLEEEEAG